MQRSLRHVGVVLALVLFGTVGATSGPALADTVGDDDRVTQTQRFAADSGDDCTYGYTEGVLEWRPITAPPGRGAVILGGTLTDRPTPVDPGLPCADDKWLTFAIYSGYSQAALVDEVRQRVDNHVIRFSFALEPRLAPGSVDTVVIQVCRIPIDTTQRPMYCGKPKAYPLNPAVR